MIDFLYEIEILLLNMLNVLKIPGFFSKFLKFKGFPGFFCLKYMSHWFCKNVELSFIIITVKLLSLCKIKGGANQGKGGGERRDPPSTAKTHLQWKTDVR